mmetsp:Transcript_40416/g.126100  ORF Transcript_40416/g.126100 Transcript_40416/m.126100 type:complete len:133 (+) Transcript_40416:498-896(+)
MPAPAWQTPRSGFSSSGCRSHSSSSSSSGPCGREAHASSHFSAAGPPRADSGRQEDGGEEAWQRVDREEERFQESLDTFFKEFHRHIVDPVLLRLQALMVREDLSRVDKGPFPEPPPGRDPGPPRLALPTGR